MAGLFTIKKTENNQFIFRLSDADGQVLFTSEPYSSLIDVQDGIISLKDRAESFPNFERKKNTENKMYFNIRTSTGNVIGSSERYSSIADLENSITAVNKSAPDAEIINATGE